tara:strand:- start:2063 stop:2326 length:264 start_codon:yes stop_codon:yes gene_type:complete
MRLKKMKWRKTTSGFWSQPIYEKDWPILIKAMVESNLTVDINNKVEFYYGEYKIQPKEIQRVWKMSPHQYRKLCDKILVEGYGTTSD